MIKNFNDAVCTFNSTGLKKGDLVAITSGLKAIKASGDKPLTGICVSSNGYVAGVMLQGAITVKYNDTTAPVVGSYTSFICPSEKYVKTATSSTGKSHLVLDVDEVNHLVTILL